MQNSAAVVFLLAHRGAAQSQLVLAARAGRAGASSSPHVTAAASRHRATVPTPGTAAAMCSRYERKPSRDWLVPCRLAGQCARTLCSSM